VIGVGDLRLDLNLPLAMTGDEPEFTACLEKARVLSKKYKIPIAGYIPSAVMKERLDLGYRSVESSFSLGQKKINKSLISFEPLRLT
jgi:hypothetical protein